MTSAPIRDQLGDHLITPQNAALVVIDYQPSQFATVRSMDPEPAAEERRLDREDGEGVRAADRPFDGERRIRPAAADRSRAGRAARGQPADRPHERQLVGGRRLRGGRACHRPAQADLLCALDGGLHGVRGARRVEGGLRGLSRRSTRSAARPSRRTAPASSVSSRRAACRSAGSRSRASCSATGTGWRRCRRSSRSC